MSNYHPQEHRTTNEILLPLAQFLSIVFSGGYMELDIYDHFEDIKMNRLCKISDELYFSNQIPGVSRSLIATALKTPSKIFVQQNETEAMRLGRAFHAYMLEPHVFHQKYHFLGSDYDSKRQSTIDKHVADGTLPSGKLFIRSKDESWMRASKAEAKRHKLASPHLNFDKKFVECSLFTHLYDFGYDVRVKADLVDLTAKEIIDFKSIAKIEKVRDKEACKKYIRAENYDLQAYFYTQVFNQVFGGEFKFRLVFFEKKSVSPGIRCVTLSGDSLGSGRNKMQKGFENLERAVLCRELDQSYSNSDKEDII